jgi:hypothetical protein
MDHMPPVFVQPVGNQYRRYLIRDSIAQFWTGNGWTANPSEAVLFYTEVHAIEARNRIGLGGDLADTFTATIVLSTQRDEWTTEELTAYLRRHRKSFLRGPAGKNGILLEIVPAELKRIDRPVETDDGSD